MVNVSSETPIETEHRLQEVLRRADLVVLPGVWSYFESPSEQPPVLDESVLAVVRDETSWSALRPHPDGHGTEERFGVFSFHFPDNLDNSGFVGWLATALKIRLGTGVFVVCGSNSARGGVYDYWGCPADLLPDAVGVIKDLMADEGAQNTRRSVG